MKRVVIAAADVVYEWANRYVDPNPLSLPYYWLASGAAFILDRWDPIVPKNNGGSGGVSGS